MGDRVGQYSQTVMDPGMTTQKYNPEVPYEGEGFRVNTQVNELVDKLISNRQKMSNVVSAHIISSFRLFISQLRIAINWTSTSAAI